MRLQRYLAASGVASRRRSEELIVAGLVRVNGRVVRELGTSVVPEDVVEFGGRIVAPALEPAYIVMNKPLGVVTTMRDPEGRRTIADVLRGHAWERRVVPVGRLDYDTAGVLLLTDDGGLAHVLTHPRFGVEKTYRATLRGRLTSEHVADLQRGMKLDDGPAQPARLRVVAARRDASSVDVTIHEGRNRQIRRMFEELGHPVMGLTRLRFGPIGLGTLVPGEIRAATAREISALRVLVDAAAAGQDDGE
ncbi:MAG TPA: pseudouridine synthase [Candidatus Lustribacter sp.]